jgi:magnesium-transporting ATPase (P-type)
MKDVPSTVMISGTKVLSGEGKMICLVVGNSSCIGHIRSLVEERGDRLTPLQAKLEKLASDIGKFGLYSAIIIVLILLIRFTIERVKEHSWVTSIHLPELLNYFITGITVVVVAIPEGLPLAVTLTLAYSVKKMLLDNNLVRRM